MKKPERDKNKNPRMGDRKKPNLNKRIRKPVVDTRDGWLLGLKIGDNVLIKDEFNSFFVSEIVAITYSGRIRTIDFLEFWPNGTAVGGKHRIEPIPAEGVHAFAAKKMISALFMVMNKFLAQEAEIKAAMYDKVPTADILNLQIAQNIINSLCVKRG